MMTLREMRDRVRELAWQSDIELRAALAKLFNELERAIVTEVVDEKDENGSTALARRDPVENEAANTLARLEAERQEFYLLAEEFKLRLHLVNKLNVELNETLFKTQAACEALRDERDRAKADALAARSETFSKLIDRELELRLQPDQGEDEVRRVAQLLAEKEAAYAVLQCHEEATVIATDGNTSRRVELIVSVRDQQTWTFALPTKMALFYLEVVAAAWIRTVDTRYNEIMSKHRTAAENENA